MLLRRALSFAFSLTKVLITYLIARNVFRVLRQIFEMAHLLAFSILDLSKKLLLLGSRVATFGFGSHKLLALQS